MKLVEYKGGGFDGCWWEWNFFLLTDDGLTHDVYSSGYKGATTHDARLSILSAHAWTNKHNVYDLSDETEMLQCFSGMNGSNASLIAGFLFLEMDIITKAHCEHCGEIFNIHKMHVGNYFSDGGISYSAHDLFCDTCVYIADREE